MMDFDNRYVLADILDEINIQRVVDLSLKKEKEWFYKYLKSCFRSTLDYCYILVNKQKAINYLYFNNNFLYKFEKVLLLLYQEQNKNIILSLVRNENYKNLINENIKKNLEEWNLL